MFDETHCKPFSREACVHPGGARVHYMYMVSSENLRDIAAAFASHVPPGAVAIAGFVGIVVGSLFGYCFLIMVSSNICCKSPPSPLFHLLTAVLTSGFLSVSTSHQVGRACFSLSKSVLEFIEMLL